MYEVIDTFITDDKSWCPCKIDSGIASERQFPGRWGFALTLSDWGDSNDQGCKSVMVAIQSFNNYKISWDLTTHSASYWMGNVMDRHVIYTTPPLPRRGYWTYPRTERNGDIMIPLVTRLAGPDFTRHVFGNEVQPSDSALFPESFVSIYLPEYTARIYTFSNGVSSWRDHLMNPCFSRIAGVPSYPPEMLGTGSCLEVITPPMRDDKPIRPTTRDPPTRKAAPPHKTWSKVKSILSPSLRNMELYIRVLALLFILGLLILILYYENTILPDTSFEAFMDGQSFGVRILFTTFGTITTTFWSYYFSCMWRAP